MSGLQNIESLYPHSVEIEQIIIATCCNDDNDECLPLLPSNILEMFYRQDMRELMSVVMELSRDGIKPDLLSVSDRLEDDEKRRDKCGGLENVLNVINSAWNSGANFQYHLDKLVSLYRRRQTIKACEMGIAAARDRTDDNYFNGLVAGLDAVDKCSSVVSGVRSASEIAREFIEKVKHGNVEPQIKLGITQIDNAIGGVSCNSLNVIGGRTGMGKTAVALAVARSMFLDGKRVLYFNLEMSNQQIIGRLISGPSKVPYRAFTKGIVTGRSLDKLEEAQGHLFSGARKDNFLLVSRGGLCVDDIVRIATIENIKQKIDVIFVDYLGRLKITGVDRNSHVAYGEVTRKLKSMALKLNIAVFLLVQGNRENERANDKRMSLSSIAGSDAIAADSDNVFLLYRPAYYTQDDSQKDVLEINHAKARFAAPRRYGTLFSLDMMMFYDGPWGGEVTQLSKKANDEMQGLF